MTLRDDNNYAEQESGLSALNIGMEGRSWLDCGGLCIIALHQIIAEVDRRRRHVNP